MIEKFGIFVITEKLQILSLIVWQIVRISKKETNWFIYNK